MIIINVLLKVKPEKREEFLVFVEDLVSKSRQDEGALFYDCLESLDTKNQFMIIENWRDQAAVDLHNETAHLKKFIVEIDQYLAADKELKKIAYPE
ncbi:MULTISPECIES: putative quinol monooxygenase [Enterococcus]|uniref:Antibiotic biosynthesis monooxygenase n=1 Tax=Enterococcus alishanensis TaxID=1303817 RepID=A0ABS6TAV6_9ENTE|nr:putative quinol monooxygenase [Enterococcus alishanensis]MBV7390034.1 antibiotic biosynthesis monooxygenase [Enterococcus alishanensis]